MKGENGVVQGALQKSLQVGMVLANIRCHLPFQALPHTRAILYLLGSQRFAARCFHCLIRVLNLHAGLASREGHADEGKGGLPEHKVQEWQPCDDRDDAGGAGSGSGRGCRGSVSGSGGSSSPKSQAKITDKGESNSNDALCNEGMDANS